VVTGPRADRPRDAAGWLLAAAVRLLPARRHDWGRAMRAELAGIAPARDRWGFALGCTRAVVTDTSAVLALARRLLVLTALGATVGLALRSPAALVIVGVLAGVAWVTSRPRAFGPAADSRTARALRGVALVAIGAQVVLLVVSLRLVRPDRAPTGPLLGDRIALIVWTALMGAYIVALIRVTAGTAVVAGRTLVAGTGAGAGSGLLWTVACLALPALPTSTSPALVAMLVAALAGAWSTRRQGQRQSIIAALCAATTAALFIDLVIEDALPVAGRWVSTSYPPVYPAGSMERLVDPIGILIIGALAAVVLGATVRSRRRAA
jgi:hypothetical protein